MKDLGKITVQVVQSIKNTYASGAKSFFQGSRSQASYRRSAVRGVRGSLNMLGGVQSSQGEMSDVLDFARRPSIAGSKDLLKSNWMRSMKGGSMARFAPGMARAIAALGVAGAVFAAVGVAVAAVVVAFKKLRAMLESFVAQVGQYNGKISAATALAEVAKIKASVKAGQGISGTFAAAYVRSESKLETALLRLQAAMVPLSTVFVGTFLDMMTSVVETLAGIFEAINRHWGEVQYAAGTAAQIGGIAGMVTGMGMGSFTYNMGSTLKEISKNTKATAKNTEKPVDWTEANQGFIADLALMGVDSSYAKSRLE